jgi:hypothetical protein
MGKVNANIIMELNIMEIGKMMKRMEKENYMIKIKLDMMVNG